MYLGYKTKERNLLWKQKNLALPEEELEFLGDSSLPKNIKEMDSAYEFFSLFFDEEVFMNIVNQTNLYIRQKNPNNTLVISKVDVRNFIGIILYMSIVHMPNVRYYWSKTIGMEKILETMPQNKFEQMREFIHFNNNYTMLPLTNRNSDRLFKIRPLITSINKNFQSIPLEQYLSIDEQMCSCKARSFIKQYMPLKPSKWGFKLFVLCGSSGFAYNFEIYTGQENVIEQKEPNLGASANVVVRLAKIIPKYLRYRLYFDNYYTTLSLLQYLFKSGIHSLGTIRRNRIPNCKLPLEKDMIKMSRGTSMEYVAEYEGVSISSIVWKDNKMVTLASTFVGEHPKSTIKRFDRVSKKDVQIECPNIIKEYNRHMGGVDLLDSIVGRYKILLRSKRWYIRLFYHLLDLSVSNAWLLYRRAAKDNGNNNTKNAADFRLELANTLCNLDKIRGLKRGRKSDVQRNIEEKSKKSRCQSLPTKEVRTDEIGHWPVLVDKRMRCKMPKCPGFTYTMCEKCDLALCLNKTNSCFTTFHKN